MAQKQFKIGLSNTDKQNMAQDVYERLLALTFPEYNTTTQYDVGDFVVYNDQLYKCIGATSGAWDSTKWQLATLNDLVTDIEGAVASVNDKANVDGNYPTMTVGVADQLSPYDENSGDDQDEPFTLQATGTGNGTQPDFATGSIALMKEKQGNTVVVNQAIQNGDFSNGTTGWNTNNSTLTVSNGVASFTATAQNGRFSQSFTSNLIQGHKYLLHAKLSEQLNVNIYSSGNSQYIYNFNNFAIFEVNYSPSQIRFYDGRSSDWSTITVEDVFLIDLTQWFNGDIPQDLLDHPSNFFRYYQGSLAYNEGTLVNANGRYIKCVGRNQCDEVFEGGNINSSGNYSQADSFRTKNYQPAIPNSVISVRRLLALGGLVRVFEYDKDKNYIQDEQVLPASSQQGTYTLTSNTIYVRFAFYKNGSGWQSSVPSKESIGFTYSLYYEGESGYDQYYPYQVLCNIDTGVEVLRKAGNVADIKLPSGEIKRNVGVVDLGTLNWDKIADYGFYSSGISSLVKSESKPLCSKYVSSGTPNDWTSGNCFIGSTGNIGIADLSYTDGAAFKTDMSGVYLFYELADPTTEQGTPYSENLVIDDFGSMDFEGTNGVPQGCLIFYPVDYKAFIDTLYNYTEGTPSNIALKSDVSTEQSARQAQDTALLNAVGGTLRQVLCLKETLDFEDTDAVDLGELTWTYSELDGNPAFTSTISGAKTTSKTISTRYEKQDGYQSTNKTYTLQRGETGTIWVIDNSYTDAVAFKAAVQGVIVAFEKA